jgi:ABC-2 type transport system permease protein
MESHMKRILDLTAKDILQNLRDRQTFLFLLIMPIGFTLLFGFAFGGFSKTKEDSRLVIGYLDLDQGQLSSPLRLALEASTVIRLNTDETTSESDLEKQVAEDDLAAALIVPQGFSAGLLDEAPLPLLLIADPTSQAGQAVQNELRSIISHLTSAVLTAQAVQSVQGDLEDFQPAFTQALEAWQEPAIRLNVVEASSVEKAQGGNPFTSFAHTSPGMMLQFAIAGLLGAAQVIVNERKSRTLQRLLTTPITRVQVLIGHYLAIVLIILCQLLLLIVFGQLILKLNYFSHLPATLVMALTTALCVGALGLLIGAFARTEEQAVIFTMIPMFILAGLGGAWVPLEVTGAAFQAVGHLSPVAWAMDGFKDILLRGGGMELVWLPALALLGYTGVFFGFAVWRFRFE